MQRISYLKSAVVFLLVAVVVTAQETPPTDRVFIDSVRVDVVNVEVFVVDRQGRPVYGLEREDFQLLVKGRPMEISNFYAPRPPAEALAKPETAALEAVKASPPPRHIVVFVDHTNLLPARRRQVVASLRTLIEERLAQGDRVMIAAYDARVEILSNFGDDPGVHAAALETIDHTGASTSETHTEFNRILRCMEVSCNEPELIWDDVNFYARQLRHRSRIMLAHLGTVIDSMAGLPGRRSLLIVGDGIAARPGESLYAIYQRRYSGADGGIRYQFEANRYSLNREIEEITDLANARRVTLYVLNNGGVVGSPLSMSSSAVSTTQIIDTEIDFVRDANYSASMQQFAVNTGGRIIYNPNDETLDEIRQDFDAAYSLGFAPDHEPDDKARDIKVRVLRDGVKVRYRDNYTLTTDEGSAAVRTKIAMMLGETTNPLGISAEFDPSAKRAGRRRLIQVAVRIPIGPLTMVPVGGDRFQGRLEFAFYLEDEDGASTPIQESELPLELPGEAVSSKTPIHITYDVGFKVRPGDHRLALTVTDALGSTASTLSWNVSIAGDGAVTVTDR
ncbi:MAG: VWA domain-containing protein [Thermoanaerobaculales bacterium]